MRRRVVVAAVSAVAVFALVAVVVVVMTRGDDEPTSVAIDRVAAAALAEEACVDLAEFERMVREDERAELALRTLDQARAAADDAVRFDPRWVRLASGIQAVNAGIDRDDPSTTRIGIALARSQCEQVR